MDEDILRSRQGGGVRVVRVGKVVKDPNWTSIEQPSGRDQGETSAGISFDCPRGGCSDRLTWEFVNLSRLQGRQGVRSTSLHLEAAAPMSVACGMAHVSDGLHRQDDVGWIASTRLIDLFLLKRVDRASERGASRHLAWPPRQSRNVG